MERNYTEDANDIYNRLKQLKADIKENKCDFKEGISELKKDFENLEDDHLKLMELIHQLSTDFKIESEKMTVRLGIITFIVTTVITVVLENLVGTLKLFG